MSITPNYLSPININTKAPNIYLCTHQCELIFHYKDTNLNITCSNKDVSLAYNEGSYVSYKSKIYTLKKITFYSRSCHELDNTDYPLEAIFWHVSHNNNEILALSVLIENTTNLNPKSSVFFNSFVRYLKPQNSGKIITIKNGGWNFYNLIPDKQSFYSYMGSTLNKPYKGNVTWIVMKETVQIEQSTFIQMQTALKNVTTPSIQDTLSRKISYNKGTNQEPNHAEKIVCYTEKEFQEKYVKIQDSEENKTNNIIQLILQLIGTIILPLGIGIYLYKIQHPFYFAYMFAYGIIILIITIYLWSKQ